MKSLNSLEAEFVLPEWYTPAVHATVISNLQHNDIELAKTYLKSKNIENVTTLNEDELVEWINGGPQQFLIDEAALRAVTMRAFRDGQKLEKKNISAKLDNGHETDASTTYEALYHEIVNTITPYTAVKRKSELVEALLQ